MNDITPNAPPPGAFTSEAPAPISLAARSTAVTVVAVANFVVAALEVLYGLHLLLGAGLMGAAGNMPGVPAEFQQATSGLAALIVVFAVLAFLMGALMVAAGWGTLNRQPWGRVLTLVLGGLAVLAALGSLAPLNALGLVLHAGYAVLVLVVLLNPAYAAEFGSTSGNAEVAPGQAGPGLRLEWPLAVIVLVALCLGAGLGWGLAQLTAGTPVQEKKGPGRKGPKPKVAVYAADEGSEDHAKRVAAALANSDKLRVIDTWLGNESSAKQFAESTRFGRQFATEMLIVAERQGTLVKLKAVEGKTGVLLAVDTVDLDVAGQLRKFAEGAAAKLER